MFSISICWGKCNGYVYRWVNVSRCHSNGVDSAKYLQSGCGALNRPSSYCVKEISYMYHFNFFVFCWTLEEPSKQTEFFKY